LAQDGFGMHQKVEVPFQLLLLNGDGYKPGGGSCVS
jgi:hypothetical protein